MSKKTNQKPERQAHRTHSKRYWKNKAEEFATSLIYSPENIARMKMGYPPRRLALIQNNKTGETIEFHAPIELHHVFGIKGDVPQEDQTLVELYPWQHAACDTDRKFGWTFVQWIGFQ